MTLRDLVAVAMFRENHALHPTAGNLEAFERAQLKDKFGAEIAKQGGVGLDPEDRILIAVLAASRTGSTISVKVRDALTFFRQLQPISLKTPVGAITLEAANMDLVANDTVMAHETEVVTTRSAKRGGVKVVKKKRAAPAPKSGSPTVAAPAATTRSERRKKVARKSGRKPSPPRQ